MLKSPMLRRAVNYSQFRRHARFTLQRSFATKPSELLSFDDPERAYGGKLDRLQHG